MGWILEEEKKGVEGEPARARTSLKLAALSWGIYFILWESGLPVLKMLGILFLLSAWVFSAKAFFHVVTMGIIRLPSGTRGVAQVLVALGGAAVSLVYLFPGETDLSGQILVHAFEPFIKSLLFWLPISLFVYIVYAASSTFSSFLAVRRYLVLAAAIFLLVLFGGYGGFNPTDEDGYSSSVEKTDPKSIEGQMDMAASYLRLIILGYGTLLFSDIRQRVLRRRLETAVCNTQDRQ